MGVNCPTPVVNPTVTCEPASESRGAVLGNGKRWRRDRLDSFRNHSPCCPRASPGASQAERGLSERESAPERPRTSESQGTQSPKLCCVRGSEPSGQVCKNCRCVSGLLGHPLPKRSADLGRVAHTLHTCTGLSASGLGQPEVQVHRTWSPGMLL